MSQHDGTIANDTGANTRTDIQNAIQAAFSTHKGNNAPSTPYAGQLWIDDNTPSSSVWTLFAYDGSDWISVGTIDTTSNSFTLKNGVPLTGSGGVGGVYYYTGQTLWGQNSTTQPGSGNTTIGAAVSNDGSFYFSNNGSFVGNINRNSDGVWTVYTVNGSGVGVASASGGVAFFGAYSDYRLKANVEGMAADDAEARVKALRPVRFNYARFLNEPKVDGFIAHEVAAVIPEAVHGAKDAVDADGNVMPQALGMDRLVPALTAALQSALAKIEALEARVAALEPQG